MAELKRAVLNPEHFIQLCRLQGRAEEVPVKTVKLVGQAAGGGPPPPRGVGPWYGAPSGIGLATLRGGWRGRVVA